MASDLEKTRCYYCSNDNAELLYRIKGFREDERAYNVVKCRNCSFVYLNPRYSPEENFRIYQDSYYTSSATDPSGHSRNFMAERQRKKNDHRVEFNYIKKYKRGGRILDFGSATGFFLESIYGKWEKHAVDISEFAIRNINDPSVLKFHGTLQEAQYKERFFDVIYCSHTLDRIIELEATIRELGRILKTDGIMLVTVPNIESLCARVFKERFRLLYANHLVYFSHATLEKFMMREGLKVIDVKYPFYRTSFFSWPHLPGSVAKITLQAIINIFAAETRLFVSPPFWGNVMSAIIARG